MYWLTYTLTAKHAGKINCLFELKVETQAVGVEGQKIAIGLRQISGTPSCSTESTDPSKATIDIGGPFSPGISIQNIIATKAGSSDFAHMNHLKYE
ncbi:DgyrCDS14800 [Dimorphilus gyrociliatus]|uniref:DgyrCDS14800 n=1 Tax=Dimorphilus gyrociliatus TaxID=2664684 RepID=A0A7I8WEW0_9ANNE|nr:DgyrCDS14800 [Dimorphilus gyrociliatus]